MAALLLCLLPVPALSADTPVSYVKRILPAVKTATPPKIDGDLSDPAWKDAAKAEVFLDREHGNVVADQTTAWLCYDDKYLYIAFYCKDSHPEQIVARETVRNSKYAVQDSNSNPNREDNVTVMLDPFLSHQSSDVTVLSMNAIGTPSAQLGGGRGGKTEWEGDWGGAVKRVADGWTVEIRAPWAMLNYPSSKQPCTMGVNFFRWQDHTKIESVWSNIGPQGFLEDEGLWKGVQVPAGAFHPNLSLLPYSLPSIGHGGATYHSGLDARYTVTPELTAVGSLNPDFATIEGAVEGIQFSHTERFVPDRRPFFLEGSNFFQPGTQINDVGAFFYPNRIQTFDLGTKLYGKVTPTDTLGFLHTIAFGNENDLVLRYKHDITPTAQAGFFFTQRSARNDNNTVGLLDERARWGKFGLESQFGLSSGKQAGGGMNVVSFTFQDRTFVSALQFHDISPIFRDANGFIPFTGYRGLLGVADYSGSWRKGFWRNYEVGSVPILWWHQDGRPYQQGVDNFFSLETRSDWRVGLDVGMFRFDGKRDETYTLFLKNGVSNRFRQWGLQFLFGTQGGRPSTFISPTFSYRLFRKFDLAYGGAIQNLDGVTQQHILTMNYELSPTRSFGGRVVWQDADMNAYLFFRNAGHRGMETYFIIGDPNARRFVKSISFKFVFAV